MRDQRFDLRGREALRCELRAYLAFGFSEHQRFALRIAVREHDRVVAGQRMMLAAAHDEIGGHDLRALMQHLIESVLALGARAAPHPGTRRGIAEPPDPARAPA